MIVGRIMVSDDFKYRPEKLPGLTGLRGVGALWVLLFHIFFGRGVPIVEHGDLGVDIFFILSGFVLCHAHRAQSWGGAGYWGFLQARVARIFPLNTLALAMTVVIALTYPRFIESFGDGGIEKFSVKELVFCTLLVQNWGLGNAFSWNLPAWSLSAEWLASLVFPLLLLATKRVGSPRALVGMAAFALMIFAICLMMKGSLTALPGGGKLGLVRMFCEFFAGCCLSGGYWHGMRAGSWVSWAAVIVLCIALIFPDFLIASIFSFAVGVLLAADNSSRFGRFLSTPVMQYFGGISFSIYLLHWPLLMVFNRAVAYLSITGQRQAICTAIFFLGIIGLSTLVYRYFEAPMRSWVRNI